MLTITENLSQLYEEDYILWLEKNIQFIKDGKFKYVDLENLIEELESLGKSEKRTVESLIKQIIIHLLLYQYWDKEREWNGEHSVTEILAFRDDLKFDIKSKTIYNYAQSQLDNIYESALKRAQSKSKLQSFPSECPYTLAQIIDENWLPSISNQ